MKQHKGLVLTLVVLFGLSFFAFRHVLPLPSNGVTSLQQRLLAAVGSLLEQQHYSPKKIDDAFSKIVFKSYLDQMDGDKSLFLQSDVQQLKKYETLIDDELHGAPLQFQPAAGAIYEKRIAEAAVLYKKILAQPFDFSVNEAVVLDGDKLKFPANEAERMDRWRKKLKYYTLERYNDLLEEQEKNAGKPEFKVRGKDSLEAEARTKVLKMMDRMFNRFKTAFNAEQQFNAFVNTVTNAMDPHTDYFPPLEKRAFDERMSNQFYGIGAQLQQDDNGIKIASLVTGGPAWKTGEFTVGDLIVKVGQGSEEQVDISGYAVEDAVKLIRGNKGTVVKLTLKKQDGTYKTLQIVREKIEQDEGLARSAVVLQGGEKIGYISLPDFYANFEDENGFRCSRDVANEIIKLKKENVKGIVMDLRNNGGGSLAEVVKMVGLFIKTGPVVQVRERDGSVDHKTWTDNDPSVLWDGPLTVMVNELSASASEIFAAAIQDYKRGIVIGSSSTYGKGTVQRPIPFGRPIDYFSGRTEYGAVSLTFQKFYRVNGGSTQLKGVVPDVVLPDGYEFLKIREKDNEHPLPWDAVNPTAFSTWSAGAELSAISKKQQLKITSDPNLSLLHTNLKWLNEASEQPIPLEIKQFQGMQKKIQQTVTQNNNLLKLKNEMTINCLDADKDKFFDNPDKNKGIRYQEWLKSLKTDLYIQESVQIAADLYKNGLNRTALQ